MGSRGGPSRETRMVHERDRDVVRQIHGLRGISGAGLATCSAALCPVAHGARHGTPPLRSLLSDSHGNHGKRATLSPHVQVAVPIGYSAYRMALLKTWLVMAWQLMDQGSSSVSSSAWATAHFGLALINTVFWAYNTFVMLLRVLPPCLDGDRFHAAAISCKYNLVPMVVNEPD